MTRQSVCGLALVLLVVAAIDAGSAHAQGGSGKIEGRVWDSQQFAMPQAVVELQDAQGNTIRKVIGDDTGHYEFDSVAPGTYAIKVSRNGFETAAKSPVSVSDGQEVALDVTLQPQPVAQSITVLGSEDDRQVASKTDIPADVLPVTVNTVPLEIIEQQDDTSIVPVINNLPGANAITEYGSLNYFVFRGFQMDKDPGSAVLLNGLRIEGNRFDSQLNSVESVDVLKGPASMLYGTEDTGGTINIVQKSPLSTPHYDVVVHGSRWGTGGIEFGATGPVANDENLLYRVDAAYMHSDGWRGDGYNRFNLSPRLKWQIGPHDKLNSNIIYNLDHFDLDAGIPLLGTPANAYNPYLANIVPDIPFSRRFNTPGNFEYGDNPVVQAFYEHKFSNHVVLRQAAEFQYIGDEYWDSEFLYVDPIAAPTEVQRYYLYFFHRDHAAVSQTDLLTDFHLIWKHQFLVGYEFDWVHHETKRSDDAENAVIPPINLYNPVETATAITSFPPSDYDGLRNRSNAIYFQDYVNIHPKLQLLVAGRYDAYQHYDFYYPVVNGVGVTGPPTDSFAQNPFTYRVGINSQLFPMFSVYTSYSTSFQAQTEVSTAGNPLVPETGSQFEAGARLNLFQNRLSLDAAFYHIIQKHVAVEEADGTIEQAGQQYAKGAEVELRGRVSQRLTAYTSYGFTQTAYDSFISQDGDGTFENLRGFVPGLVPKHTARLWTNYEFPKGFGVSLGTRYVSRQAPDQFDHFWMGGFTTWDAAFRYHREKWEYSVNFSNFLNKTRYFVSAIDDTQLYPGPPIDIAGTIRYRF
jgi:iron complex outermembrane recepter protein